MIVSISGKLNSGKDTVGKIWQIIDGSPHFTTKGVMEFLNKPYDSRFEIKKWADSLKDMVCILLGCTREELENRDFKEKELGEEWWYTYGKIGNVDILVSYLDMDKEFKNSNNSYIEKLTPRELLQIIGTDYIRNKVHPNAWVNALMSEYKALYGYQTTDSKINIGDISVPIPGLDIDKRVFPNWIITDTRFPNELKAVKDRDGITIRVNRFKEKDKVYWTDPDTTEFAEGASSGVYSIIKLYDEFCLLSNDVGSETEVPYDEIKLYIENQHESETALDNATFDYYINNNGTLEELIEKVVKIYQDVKKNKLL